LAVRAACAHVLSCRAEFSPGGWTMRWAVSSSMSGLVVEGGRHRRMMALCETATWAHRCSGLVQRTWFHCIAATHTGNHVKVCALCPADRLLGYKFLIDVHGLSRHSNSLVVVVFEPFGSQSSVVSLHDTCQVRTTWSMSCSMRCRKCRTRALAS